MATAWRWLNVVGLGVVAAYGTWYLACPSGVGESIPPVCSARAGWRVPCAWEGWCDVVAVAAGALVSLVTWWATRRR